MKLEVFFTPGEAEGVSTLDATVVVVDAIRSTTSMVEALAHGAVRIYPTASAEDAVRLATSLGREDTLLAGERKGVKIEGFDLGNSPSEFSEDVVRGKRLAWSTTNGTAALARAQEAQRALACAFTNLSAVAAALQGSERVIIQCAGRGQRFAIDDALCAGHLLRRILGDETPNDLNDGARAALALARRVEPSPEFLATTEAGRALAAIGLEADLAACARVDVHSVAPEMRDQALVAVG